MAKRIFRQVLVPWGWALELAGRAAQWPRMRSRALAAREGRPLLASTRSAQNASRSAAFTPSQRSGSGSHAGER